jgi:hypothetical protein
VWPGNVSKHHRLLPQNIPKPPYYATGFPEALSFSNPEIKDEFQIAGMRRACTIACNVLESVGYEVEVRISH